MLQGNYSGIIILNRENAILGLYEKALTKYQMALPIIQKRISEVKENTQYGIRTRKLNNQKKLKLMINL